MTDYTDSLGEIFVGATSISRIGEFKYQITTPETAPRYLVQDALEFGDKSLFCKARGVDALTFELTLDSPEEQLRSLRSIDNLISEALKGNRNFHHHTRSFHEGGAEDVSLGM